eukprot:symbB.v1.2.024791.t1/scaffold2372.1/size80857/1
MTTGKSYKLCVDLDGSLRDLAFVETGLLVQITSITGVVSTTYNAAGVTDLELTTSLADGSLPQAYGYVGAECSTAFSASAGERNTVVQQTVLGVVSGVISFPLTVLGLVEGKMYRACIDEDGPLAQGFVDVGGVYVTPITVVSPSGVARATNQQLEIQCTTGVCSTDTKLYLTSKSCNTLITNGDPGDEQPESPREKTSSVKPLPLQLLLDQKSSGGFGPLMQRTWKLGSNFAFAPILMVPPGRNLSVIQLSKSTLHPSARWSQKGSMLQHFKRSMYDVHRVAVKQLV